MAAVANASSFRLASKHAAALRAREIYQALVANGWEIALGQFKLAKAPKKIDSTIGEFLSELRTLHASKVRCLENYTVSLRAIAAWIAGIPNGVRGGSLEHRRQWREQIDALKLSILTPAKIQKWKEAFLVRAGDDPLKQKAARTSVNSKIREARSLFSSRYVERLETVSLPNPLPFTGVKLERRSMPRYQSTFDVTELISAAAAELPGRPEEYKAFLLSLMAGLRRAEIDKLEWSSFNWPAGTINITATEFFRTKSEESARTVWVPPEVMALFRGYHATASGRFVIESPVLPATGKNYDHYRCDLIFDRLIAWLRSKGVSGPKPLHILRKRYGSLIASRYGIYAAQQALGHADVTTTARHYLQMRERPTVGLGHLLPPSPKNVIPFEERREKEA